MAEQGKPSTLQVPTASGAPPSLQKYSPDTSQMNWKSQQYMPGVATEVESEWMEKLYQKFKQIDTMKDSLQKEINNLDKDHVAQKQALNKSFDAMLSLLEQRRNALLETMNQKVSAYKKDLNTKLNTLTNERKQFTQIKGQYEANVNNKQLTDIEQRENTNVQMISDALSKSQSARKLKPKHAKFLINQSDIDERLRNVADFQLAAERPDAPIVSVLVRTSESALIEILMHEKYNDDPVAKYELNVYKGEMDEKEQESVNENHYLKVEVEVIQDDNISFYQIGDLDDNEIYHIRLRAILKDEDMVGQYCKWIRFNTKPLGSDNENEADDVEPYTREQEEALEAAWNRNMENVALKNREITHFDAWLMVFKRTELGLSRYQQMRMFFCMQHVEQGPGSKIGASDFANFVLSVGQRFDSKEYRKMCQTIKDKILNR